MSWTVRLGLGIILFFYSSSLSPLLTQLQPPASNKANITAPKPHGEQYQIHLCTDLRKASIAMGKLVLIHFRQPVRQTVERQLLWSLEPAHQTVVDVP